MDLLFVWFFYVFFNFVLSHITPYITWIVCKEGEAWQRRARSFPKVEGVAPLPVQQSDGLEQPSPWFIHLFLYLSIYIHIYIYLYTYIISYII